MRIAREIRLRRVKCLRAWWIYYITTSLFTLHFHGSPFRGAMKMK